MNKITLISVIILVIALAIYTYYTVITFGPVQGYIGDEVWYPTAAYNILKLIFHVTPPMYFPYSNEQNIQTYINPEHPPLGKYFMDIFILLLGYKPLAWRIPSWIMGDLTVIVAYLLTRKLVGSDLWGNVAGLVSAALIMLSPNIWVIHGIAILDVYVGFFSLLAVYLLLSDNRLLWASIALGLAFASKESAFPLLLPFLFYVGELRKNPIQRAIYGIGIPAATYATLSVPIMVYFGGLDGWFHNSFLYMLGWDSTNGHIALSAVTQISAPWDWFLDVHPFYLGYNFYASTNPILMWLWVGTTPLAFILKDTKLVTLTMSAWIMWLAFVAIYFLGNHTLFSFYVTDFAPLVNTYISASIFKALKKADLKNVMKYGK
ncbi:glycosyltransferase [Sulfolobus sp. S-194]|uniref:glycosyltransferase family 39 protein n=1 Tax=Sulfolobus sp. S-194 TaxID=2512240 RepID=UPI00143737C4|nr:glycosyltransferase family 39 protein [Sulfolobus sp. S-194]QIW25131.1 glycosyltransferase [Sulfolobus sp. S-194]